MYVRGEEEVMNLKRVVKLKYEFWDQKPKYCLTRRSRVRQCFGFWSKNSFFSFTTRFKFFTSVSPLTYEGRVSFVSRLEKSNDFKEKSIYESYVNMIVPLSIHLILRGRSEEEGELSWISLSIPSILIHHLPTPPPIL